jgi:alkylation response protein AidB-like acyl-CoA dehydrogenase
MHLAPTDEQRVVPDAARKFLSAEITRERRLEWDKTEHGHDPSFWKAVADLGWFGYGIPEQYGGQGASILELGLLIEECGRAVAPFGLFASFAGSVALSMLGSIPQKREWLPAIACGEKLVALALDERDAARDPRAFRRRSRAAADRAERREDVRAAGRVGAAFRRRARRNTSLVLVPRDTKGVTVVPVRTLAKDRQACPSVVALAASAIAGARRVARPRSSPRLVTLLPATRRRADAVLR